MWDQESDKPTSYDEQRVNRKWLGKVGNGLEVQDKVNILLGDWSYIYYIFVKEFTAEDCVATLKHINKGMPLANTLLLASTTVKGGFTYQSSVCTGSVRKGYSSTQPMSKLNAD